MPCILKETGFKATLLEILSTFCKGLDEYTKTFSAHHMISQVMKMKFRHGSTLASWLCKYLALQILLLPLSRSSLMLDTVSIGPFQMLKLLVYQ